MTTPSYSEVPFSENAEAAGQAPSVAPVARALVIPSAPLAIPDQAAVTELDRRIQMGNSFQRSRLFRSAAATRNVLRWHEENAGIIEGMFQDDNRDSERPLGDPIYPSGIWKMLDSEIGRLSSLRERIAVRMGRAIPGASSGDSGSSLPSADAGISVGAPPGRDSGSAPAPDLPPLTAPDEPPEVPARPLDPAAYRSIAIAAAASAALPAYDADAASSRDFIGIDAVADAFSYLLASRNAQPPLAIGLFGEWGSGKSFLMQSIRRRVDEITRGARQSPLPQSELGVYKRVVQVEFNAWHYVEGNLWASLVDHIFANLRVTPNESVSELERRRTEISRRMVSTTQQRRALNERISSLDDKRRRAERDAEALRQAQLHRLQELRRLRLSDVAAAAQLSDSEQRAVTEALGQIGLAQVGDTAIAASESLTEARALVHRGGAILAPLRSKNLLWVAGIIAAIAVAPIVAFALQKWNVSAVPKVLTSLAATTSCAVFYFRQSMNWVSGALSRIETAEAQVRARVDAETEKQSREVAQLEQAIGEDERLLAEAQKQRLEVDEQIAALQREVRELTPAKILAEFLDQRATSLDYQKHLGLTALIRRDFEKLTALVEEANAKSGADEPPAGSVADFSRVVLFVDDLDRCPPRRVVEVLQAVHLLLSFPVFAVVVAVDPRWLSRSLQQHYRGLIEGRGSGADASTAQDYLEKIFQIPYRVAPLDPRSRALFMSGLVSRLVTEPAVSARDGNLAPDPGLGLGPAAGPAPALGPALGPALDPALDPALGNATRSVYSPPPSAYLERDAGEVDLNPASLQLDDDEVRFLGELLPILDSSPRGLKRYINIYRLIKTVLGEPSPSSSGQAQRRMFLLAVLTSFPSGSDVITYVIDSPSPATQTLGDRISEFLNQRGIDEYGLAGSVTLRNWLAEQSFIASCTIAETLDDARHVRLYSFS